MGIQGLWDVLKDGEVTSLAEYASKHFLKHRRALNIAVDEAGWRYNNLPLSAVPGIRESSKRQSNPIEKQILYRVMRLLALNIRLVFVFDGPGRPEKRGKASAMNPNSAELYRNMLGCLGVHCHDAPGEAEAECTRMQILKVVDAVWSEDSDVFLFGAQVVFRFKRDVKAKKGEADTASKGHGAAKNIESDAAKKDQGAKSNTHVRLYTAAKISRQHGLDHHGCLLFAMLSGGDYHPAGLQRCGPERAKKAAQHDLGYGLFHLTKDNRAQRRESLKVFFKTQGFNIDVPAAFPDLKVLDDYRSPQVSSDAVLRAIANRMNNSIDETALRWLLGNHFNMWIPEYLKWVIPILLTRHLAQAEPNQVARLELERCSKKVTEEASVQFNLSALTSLDVPTWAPWVRDNRAPKPEGASRQHKTAVTPPPQVKCQVLDVILVDALPSLKTSKTPADHAEGSCGSTKGKKRDFPYASAVAGDRTPQQKKAKARISSIPTPAATPVRTPAPKPFFERSTTAIRGDVSKILAATSANAQFKHTERSLQQRTGNSMIRVDSSPPEQLASLRKPWEILGEDGAVIDLTGDSE